MKIKQQELKSEIVNLKSSIQTDIDIIKYIKTSAMPDLSSQVNLKIGALNQKMKNLIELQDAYDSLSQS